jgi:putative hydrolases of HD superfamily
MEDIAKFLFEVGMLSKTPRSGFHLLGTGKQSVAEHTNRVSYIGYALASLRDDVDMAKVLKMCMFHDLAEARVSDLNWMNQKYVERNENKAIGDLTRRLPFGSDMKDILEEYEERITPEAILVKDADCVEWILSLKEQLDNGNKKTQRRIESAVRQLKTSVARELVEEILELHSDDWWFEDKENDWWINRNKEDAVIEESEDDVGGEEIVVEDDFCEEESGEGSGEEGNQEVKGDKENNFEKIGSLLFPKPLQEENNEEEDDSVDEIDEDIDDDEEVVENEEFSLEGGFSRKEREILTLMNDVPADSYVEYVQRFTDYLRVDIVKIVEGFLEEGLLEKITLPEGDDERSWYFHTNEVSKDMLDSEMLFRRDFSGEL